ncbi:hypothetical protein HPB47_028220 [Ixodes persulcatus]|uniref:Uncharacterized protein n=1 Tax=Ixodes persulcatus TaxID=34615 RepID=A0AC60PUD3_IXOPE|nr:hypothetical protein HPB47_028220 [Ixodes persulcatus]
MALPMKPARGPYGSSNVENCLFVRSLTHSLSCPNFKRCFTEVLGPRGTVENDPEGAAGTHHQTHVSVKRSAVQLVRKEPERRHRRRRIPLPRLPRRSLLLATAARCIGSRRVQPWLVPPTTALVARWLPIKFLPVRVLLVLLHEVRLILLVDGIAVRLPRELRLQSCSPTGLSQRTNELSGGSISKLRNHTIITLQGASNRALRVDSRRGAGTPWAAWALAEETLPRVLQQQAATPLGIREAGTPRSTSPHRMSTVRGARPGRYGPGPCSQAELSVRRAGKAARAVGQLTTKRRMSSSFSRRRLTDAKEERLILALQICDRALYGSVVKLPGFVSIDEVMVIHVKETSWVSSDVTKSETTSAALSTTTELAQGGREEEDQPPSAAEEYERADGSKTRGLQGPRHPSAGVGEVLDRVSAPRRPSPAQPAARHNAPPPHRTAVDGRHKPGRIPRRLSRGWLGDVFLALSCPP